MITKRQLGQIGLALFVGMIASACSQDSATTAPSEQSTNPPPVSQQRAPDKSTHATNETTGAFPTQADAQKWEKESVGKSFQFSVKRQDTTLDLAFTKANVPAAVTLKHFKFECLQNGEKISFQRDGKLVDKGFSQRTSTRIELDSAKLDASPITIRVTGVWQVAYGSETEEWKDLQETKVN